MDRQAAIAAAAAAAELAAAEGEEWAEAGRL
jgi:hypothetical protein